jgi:hypothetical protein
MTVLFVQQFVGVGLASGNPFTVRFDARRAGGSAWAAAMWLNYQSKFIEYADTAFILLKGNADKQLSHLHVIHHAEMGPLMFLFCRVAAGGQSAFGPMINSLVHLFMYTYYFFSNKVEARLAKAVKPCITALQIAQFVIILAHSLFHLTAPDVYWPSTLAAVQTVLMLCVSAARGGPPSPPPPPPPCRAPQHPPHNPPPHPPAAKCCGCSATFLQRATLGRARRGRAATPAPPQRPARRRRKAATPTRTQSEGGNGVCVEAM